MNKILILILMIVAISCNSNSQKTDKDAVPDTDKTPDTETVDEIPDLSDEVPDTKSEVPDEVPDEFPDEISDEDEKNDNDPDFDEISEPDYVDEWPDYDYPAGKEGDPDCPSLLNAGFPYFDNNGRKHFCRKCDLPAPENDPQCIRNLWEMKNREIMKEWSDYYCYPLPCDVTDKAVENTGPVFASPCDVDALSRTWHQSTGVFPQSGIYEGQIGMYAIASKKVDGKYILRGNVLYEIDEKRHTFVSNSGDKMAYNHDRFLFISGNAIDLKVYIISAKKVETGWKYEFVYTDEWNRIKFIYPPAIGKNYVLINVDNVDGKGEIEILYANVNDWNFKKLGTGTILSPQIVENIAFFAINNKAYACDLSVSPGNIENDCRKITREGELTKSFAVNKQNSKKVIYLDINSVHQLNIADLSEEEITYKMLHLEKTPDLINFIPTQWDGDIFVLNEMYLYSEVQVDYRTCYYSFSRDRKVCFPRPDGTEKMIRTIYGSVEGKYITWQTVGGTRLRDMECYCSEHPENCLYDEYMPVEE
jgi:hypothetical protein